MSEIKNLWWISFFCPYANSSSTAHTHPLHSYRRQIHPSIVTSSTRWSQISTPAMPFYTRIDEARMIVVYCLLLSVWHGPATIDNRRGNDQVHETIWAAQVRPSGSSARFDVLTSPAQSSLVAGMSCLLLISARFALCQGSLLPSEQGVNAVESLRASGSTPGRYSWHRKSGSTIISV